MLSHAEATSTGTDQLESVNARLRRCIETHFDPQHGSLFWLERARELGIDALHEIWCVEDLAKLGDMTPEDLRRRPLLDYVPRRFHRRADRLVLGQTGGTTGPGTWTAYRDDEFMEAFVLPFGLASSHVGFPAGQQWLFVGPTGPHIIGKVVRHLASSLGSADPFSVDFDPRWARKLPPDSFARQRYVAHIVEQAMDVIRTQEIRVLFATPAVLLPLAREMTREQRLRIRGVHYGGMAVSTELMYQFQSETFPDAVHLSGYGNTLFGCCLELSTRPNRDIDYFPCGSRLILDVVREDGSIASDGEPGRVRFTRLDETFLIVRCIERDHATAVAPPAGAPDDFHLPGVRNPHTPAATVQHATTGLY